METTHEGDRTQSNDYCSAFLVDKTPQDVFEAIVDVRNWFTQTLEGDADRLGNVCYYHYHAQHRCTCKVTALVPGTTIVWHVLQNYFAFTTDPTEWTNTDIVFDSAVSGEKTEVRFTHRGRVPAYACYDGCARSWNQIGGSLSDFITTGNGHPLTREESA